MDGAKGGDNDMIQPFVLEKDGWHQVTNRHYHHRMAELVTQNTPVGDKYRRHFLGLPAVEKPKPLLRSLKCAQACEFLGPVVSEKPGCGGCTKYACQKLGETQLSYCTSECALWKQRASKHQSKLPKIVLDALQQKTTNAWQTIRIDETNFLPDEGGVRLNPSIIAFEDGYVFAWRNTWGNANVSVIRLTKDFAPIGNPVKLRLNHPAALKGREDPRLFVHKGILHVSFIGWMGKRQKHKHKATVLFAKLNNRTLQVEDKFHPQIPGVGEWNKNNSYFDYQNELYTIFTIEPHKVLKVMCNTVQQVYETNTPFLWRYGHIRGGASPVRFGNEYYHFFHGMIDDEYYRKYGGAVNPGGRRLYSMGVYAFEANPPFRITRIARDPIEIADPSTNPSNDGANVFFPCGAVLDGNRWIISAGVHDKWSEIRFYQASDIERQLIKV